MTPEQLATWRQLVDAAPWEFWQQDDNEVLAWQDDEKYYERVAKCKNDDIAAFIAAAREAVPALLDAVAERDAKIEKLRTELDKLAPLLD
jgi:hypothetical protein